MSQVSLLSKLVTGLLCVGFGLTFTACDGHLSPEEEASNAAKCFYEKLISGDFEGFLAGKAGADSIADSYRAQLLEGFEQYLWQQNKAHQSISDVWVSSARTDSSLCLTYVFLCLQYGDSTVEQISVPMVERHGRWLMR